MAMESFILPFDQISIQDIAKVGGKNASLGEMYRPLNPKGTEVPNGFALTAEAYRHFRVQNEIEKPLNDLLHSLDTDDFSNLIEIGAEARKMILAASLPEEVQAAVREAYQELAKDAGIPNLDVAVRSSATAEDLPSASFAGRIKSYLNISGERQRRFHRHPGRAGDHRFLRRRQRRAHLRRHSGVGGDGAGLWPAADALNLPHVYPR